VSCSDNPYKHRGVKDYYGPGYTIDTTKPFTVVTQFPTNAEGVMQSIERKYVQNGVVYEQARANLTNDQAFCDSFGGATEAHTHLGGHKGMGAALERGMVLAMSIWWSDGDFMQWLDGGDSGPCNATEGDPKVIQTIVENPVVNFSKIKWGDIGSTFKGNSTRMVRFRA
jgi:cellulase